MGEMFGVWEFLTGFEKWVLVLLGMQVFGTWLVLAQLREG